MKMLKLEKKLIDWLTNKKEILFFIIISLLGLVIRFMGRNVISGDMSGCLIPWFDEIKQGGGLAALGQQVGNYNILYQTLIAFCTYSNVSPVFWYKAISIFFDYTLALSVAWTICRMKGKKPDMEFNLVYGVILFLPTVVLNSAYWGQCDSIYTTFVILLILSLYEKKYIRAFLFLGIAFAFKFQTIFIVPFILCYYLVKKEFSVLMFGISAFIFWISGIGAFLCGRSLLDPFKIYFGQADTYHEMWMNVPSLWMLIGNDYANLNGFAIILTMALCAFGLYLLLAGKKKMDTTEQLLNTAAWFAWTCILFLPAMHDRYTYLLELLLIMLCFMNHKYIKYTALSVIISLTCYGAYLFKWNALAVWLVYIYVFAWIHFSYSILKSDTCEKTEQKRIEKAE